MMMIEEVTPRNCLNILDVRKFAFSLVTELWNSLCDICASATANYATLNNFKCHISKELELET